MAGPLYQLGGVRLSFFSEGQDLGPKLGPIGVSFFSHNRS